MTQIHSFTTFRNVALSYSELLMIIKSRGFYVLRHISNIFASLWLSQNGYEIENGFDWRRSVTGRLTFLLQL